jgi:LAO/AO transport system kinase
MFSLATRRHTAAAVLSAKQSLLQNGIMFGSAQGAFSFFATNPENSFSTDKPAWDDMTESTRILAERLTGDASDCQEDDDTRTRWKRRRALSMAITLAESSSAAKQQQAALLLTHMLETKRAEAIPKFRLGLAGAPGAGKSTFIECLGKYILKLAEDSGNTSSQTKETKKSNSWIPDQLAVVCVDPSSTVTGGSILGDKTRMFELSRHPRSFVRPAPAAGALGGLASYTDDVVSLCQTAGYELVLLETVGLGQSEVEVAQSVDMLLLLIPPGGGDDLQGVKKGIIEVADMIIVTKADGNLLSTAKMTAADYKGAMQFVHAKGRLQGWEHPPVLLASAVTEEGVSNIWEYVCRYRRDMIDTGNLEEKRRKQSRYWMWKNLQNLVQEKARKSSSLNRFSRDLEEKLNSGRMTPRVAAARLLDCISGNNN